MSVTRLAQWHVGRARVQAGEAIMDRDCLPIQTRVTTHRNRQTPLNRFASESRAWDEVETEPGWPCRGHALGIAYTRNSGLTTHSSSGSLPTRAKPSHPHGTSTQVWSLSIKALPSQPNERDSSCLQRCRGPSDQGTRAASHHKSQQIRMSDRQNRAEHNLSTVQEQGRPTRERRLA